MSFTGKVKRSNFFHGATAGVGEGAAAAGVGVAGAAGAGGLISARRDAAGSWLREGEGEGGGAGGGGMPRPPKPRALLRLQEVLDFCFPPGVEHPKAAARLFLLCEYGPLIDGWLWGGAYNARRKLSEYEIETMVTKLEREDIINAVKPEEHGRSSMLRACPASTASAPCGPGRLASRASHQRPPHSHPYATRRTVTRLAAVAAYAAPTPEEEDEVLAGVPEAMKKPYMLRRPDIVALLAPCASSPEPEVEEPVPDARIEPVESYLRAYLAPLLTALNAVRTKPRLGFANFPTAGRSSQLPAA